MTDDRQRRISNWVIGEDTVLDTLEPKCIRCTLKSKVGLLEPVFCQFAITTIGHHYSLRNESCVTVVEFPN